MFGRRDGLDLKVPLCSRVSVTYLRIRNQVPVSEARHAIRRAGSR